MDEADRQIDLTDLAMPIPLLRAAKVLRTMRSGELLVVAAQGGVREFAAFVRVNSLAELVFQQQGEGGQFFHFLRRF